MRDIVLRDDTLAEAETQRDAAVIGKLPGECAELRKALDAIRAEMSALRHAFDDLHRQHRRTSDQLDRMRGELSEAHAQLRYETAQNARGNTPCQRKVARQQGTSPSPSRPDSLMLEDPVALMNSGQNQNTAPWGLDGGESRKGQPAASEVTSRSGLETMRAKESDVDARKG
jgi:ABC-type transporter Mla subunit MlaD